MQTAVDAIPAQAELAGPVAVATTPPAVPVREGTAYGILGAISFSHLLNDMIQSLILAIYPILKSGFNLSFGQIGLITLTYQITASLLQPLVGLYTDSRPMPYSLAGRHGLHPARPAAAGDRAGSFPMLLLAAGLVGTGSSIFHPESSRVARMASGGRHGLAQSLFQVGGNLGSSLGPLLAAWIIVPHGQGSVAWFSLAALLAIVVLLQVGRWYAHQHAPGNRARRAVENHVALPTPHDRDLARRPRPAGVLEVLLPGQPEQLLHVLSDPQVRCVGAERADPSVRLPVRRRGRHDGRRADRRQDRPQVGDLGVDPRRGTVHAAAAVRQPVLDRRAQRGDRPDPRFGILGDPGLCARS